MTSLLRSVLSAALWAAPAAAQMPFLFTTNQIEQTLSGSGGTVLKTLRPPRQPGQWCVRHRQRSAE